MENLLSEIEAVIAKSEGRISPTKFGEIALGDRHLVRQLRAGRELRSKTVAKVREAIRKIDSGESAAA